MEPCLGPVECSSATFEKSVYWKEVNFSGSRVRPSGSFAGRLEGLGFFWCFLFAVYPPGDCIGPTVSTFKRRARLLCQKSGVCKLGTSLEYLVGWSPRLDFHKREASRVRVSFSAGHRLQQRLWDSPGAGNCEALSFMWRKEVFPAPVSFCSCSSLGFL